MPDINEADLIDQAIIDTEKEIASEAWGEEEPVTDADGDHTLETMGEGLEGQHGPEEEAEEAEETEAGKEGEQGKTEPAKIAGKEKDKAELEAQQGKTQQPDGRVPPGRLREEAEARRTAESERDALKAQLAENEAKSKRELDALNAKFDGLLAALKTQAQPAKADGQAKEQPAPPDMFEDPKGFAEYLERGFQSQLAQRDQKLESMRVETSMAIAHAVHKDVFENAFKAVTSLDANNPENRVTVQRIWAAPNPGQALIDWHRRNTALQRVGNDVDAYEKGIEQRTREALMKDPEFRKSLIESLRAEAGTGNDGEVNTITRLPKSLNGLAGGASAREGLDFDGSDQAIAESAWR